MNGWDGERTRRKVRDTLVAREYRCACVAFLFRLRMRYGMKVMNILCFLLLRGRHFIWTPDGKRVSTSAK
jgi:hypothetical protein